ETSIDQTSTSLPSRHTNMAKNIEDAIETKLAASAIQHPDRFLTRGSLEPLLQSEKVEEILKECAHKKGLGWNVSIPALAKFITEEALSVFAILIRMRKLR